MHPGTSHRNIGKANYMSWKKRQFVALELPVPEALYPVQTEPDRDSRYQTLPFSLRRQLHRQLALWIEPSLCWRLFSTICHSWHNIGALAEEVDKAIHYLFLQGDVARRLYALKEAIGHYTWLYSCLTKKR